MKLFLLLIIVANLYQSLIAQEVDSIIDIKDERIYKIVKIGEQWWMAENMNAGVRIDSNQVFLPNGIIEKYCHKNSDSLCKIYGGLYSIYEALQRKDPSSVNNIGAQGICPVGWHLPTGSEWDELIEYLDGDSIAGGKMKEIGTFYWNHPNTGATNESGFFALPGGRYNYRNDSFLELYERLNMWSTGKSSGGGNWSVILTYNSSEIIRSDRDWSYGLSVRCLNDDNYFSYLKVSDYNLKSKKKLDFTFQNLIDSSILINSSVYDTIDISSIKSTSNAFTLNKNSSKLYSGDTTQLFVEFNPIEKGVYYNDTVWIDSNDPYQSKISIPISVYVPDFDSIIDSRNGQKYKTVKIGEQWWMQENLNVGSMIHSNQESADNGIIEKYCYNNDSSNCTVYGGLYQWNEMMDYNPSDNKNPGTTQGICPEGWHVPSKAEWTELIDFIGGDSIAGGKLKETGTEHWLSPNAGANNESGFTALGAGYRGQNKEFYNIKMVLGYWYSTEWNSEMAWFAPIDFDDSEAKAGFYYKELGHSVRCIKNEHILIKKSDISCFGNRDGSIDLIVIYGEGPYEFLWSTGDTIEDLDSLSAGMYYVEVTDKNDSIVIDSIEIMEPESLATNVEIHNEISCYGSNDGALIVKTSGGTLPYLIQWEDHNASHDSVAWNLSADSIYHVIVSDRNNCTAIDSGFLNQPLKIITSEISGKSEVFAKEQSDYYVTETLGSVYNWTVVGGSIISSKDSSHITIEWDEQGNGSVTVIETDTNGCKGDTISLVVTIGSDNNDSFKDTILVCHQWWPLPGFNCSEAHNRIKFNSEDLSYVKIDTGINSGWEIGKTVKFNSSFHNLNVICTGLTISYSVNTETTVEFKLIGNYYGGAILVGFDHVINTDLGMDGGCIEILLPDSTRWIGLHEIGIEEFTRDIYSINDTVESLNAPGFSGLIEERDLIEFAILANGLCDFNLCKIRFRFASDSIDSMKDGWLINDIWFYSPYESVEDFRGRYVQIYPNPFNHSTSIQFPNKSMDSYDLVIIDVSGNICQIINDISTSEYILEKGNLAPGLYFIELRGPKNYRSKIIIE